MAHVTHGGCHVGNAAFGKDYARFGKRMCRVVPVIELSCVASAQLGSLGVAQ
jgi:hypothetical protein